MSNSIFDVFEGKDSVNTGLITSLLYMSPHNEISSHLKDSMAAKAANSALLKWHLGAPTASLHELEDMYNKFYEYFYDRYEHHDIHHHYHHDGDVDSDLFDYPDYHSFHHHHHHHHHHGHKHFNLVDFLAKKYGNDDYKSEKGMAFKKVMNL